MSAASPAPRPGSPECAGRSVADPEAVRARIAAERASTRTRIEALRRDFDGIVEANALVAVDDEHDPEGSSTAFERAHVAALLARADDQLAELDRAAERLDRDAYGGCESCGEAIAPARLEARPEATLCVGCAEKRGSRRR
ncbi:TraR/DksA C4-type zinc finger protein [Streptomyces sp. NBC_01218]|uniref:TraR/DksA family transcriptional regulator n=1 Tax=unclassified Streptomyces TaxID=2593676 RepID=UPI002E0E469E|nr:TraR/DksA C4-type zinc finger protein [Streptomyces sp. NBC_01218]